MEISKLSASSVRIKSKNTSFILNPSGSKIEEDAIILFERPQHYSQFESKLVIDSPGEYEVGGVSIKSEKLNGFLAFELLEDNQKVVVVSNPDSIKDAETEGAIAVLVFLSHALGDEIVSSIQTDVVLLYGPEEFLPPNKDSLKRLDKVNLKKTEDLKGYLVYLTK